MLRPCGPSLVGWLCAGVCRKWVGCSTTTAVLTNTQEQEPEWSGGGCCHCWPGHPNCQSWATSWVWVLTNILSVASITSTTPLIQNYIFYADICHHQFISVMIMRTAFSLLTIFNVWLELLEYWLLNVHCVNILTV